MEIKNITVDMGDFGQMTLDKTVEELCVLADRHDYSPNDIREILFYDEFSERYFN